MRNGSILHKRLGILYDVGEYELFHFGARADEDTEQTDVSHSKTSRMIYRRQYRVCSRSGEIPLMVSFADKVILWHDGATYLSIYIG